MISLRASNSDKGNIRVLVLSTDRLAVYHCPDMKSVWPFIFDTTTEGQRYFDRYLRETPGITTYLMVDLVQEEYRLDLIPHVSASDRRSLIMRKKQQFFKDTPYFHVEVQGRENEGRRDDIVLFMSLTEPSLLQPWVKLLMENRVPLAGICSLPQLTASLLDHLPGNTEQRLVVSVQSVSGLRQTCFQNNKLKMSRLVDFPYCYSEHCARQIQEEVGVMIHYLQSLRILNNDRPLSVYLLTAAPLMHELQRIMIDNPLLEHQFVDVGELAIKLGLKSRVAAPYCDQLLVALLLRGGFKNFYATRDEMRYFRERQAGLLMHTAGTALICASLFWGALNYIDGYEYRKRIATAGQKAGYFEIVDRIARRTMPGLKIAPADLKTLSDIGDELQQQRTGPLGMLRMISTTMSRFPMIKLERITWSAKTEPAVSVATEETPQNGAGVIMADQSSPQYHQTVILYGSIHAFDGDYRKALETITTFYAELKNTGPVRDVTILSLPLDVAPETSLEGSSVIFPAAAGFSIRIVMDAHVET